MPWIPKFNARKLCEENSRLSAALARTQEQLKVSERLQTGMKIALSLRTKKVDDLTAQIDRLRQQNRKLDAEAEHLAQLFQQSAAPAAVK